MYVVVHTAFRICRLLAFTPNTMYVVVLFFSRKFCDPSNPKICWTNFLVRNGQGWFSIREDGDRKILREDTKACVWPTHKNQENTPEIHTAFRICRLLAFTPNTMYVVVLYSAYVCCCCLHIKNRSDLYPVPFSFLLFKAKKRISVVTS